MNRRILVVLTTVIVIGTTFFTLAGVALGATNVPAWWIDRGHASFQRVQGPFGPPPPNPAVEYFTIEMWATDTNSGLMSPGVEFRVPAWMPPIYADWRVGSEVLLRVDRATHATDGIFALDYRATDRAGNTMTASVPVKIDTRPPITDGAAGWVNGLVPYTLFAVDQVPGSGVAATVYRVDQSTPWLVNAATTVAPTLATEVALTPPGGTPVQGALHTVDFGSVDAALPFDYDPLTWIGPSYHWGNFEGTSWVWNGAKDQAHVDVFTGYETRTVQLDITAPVVTAMDPKNGNWQQGPAVVNFSGADVGAGYAYTEWSTDGGSTWTMGETAEVGGDGEITITYHGVDKVGIKSADQTITVKVATTAPTVQGFDATVKKGQKARFYYNVTAVTPTVRLVIQIRTMSGRTLSTHTYEDVASGVKAYRQFKVDLKKGKYYSRISAVDLAGNVQSQRGSGTLTVW